MSTSILMPSFEDSRERSCMMRWCRRRLLPNVSGRPALHGGEGQPIDVLGSSVQKKMPRSMRGILSGLVPTDLARRYLLEIALRTQKSLVSFMSWPDGAPWQSSLRSFGGSRTAAYRPNPSTGVLRRPADALNVPDIGPVCRPLEHEVPAHGLDRVSDKLARGWAVEIL